MQTLTIRYHEMLSLRAEALHRYGRRFVHDVGGPPPKVALPSVSRTPPAFGSVRVGPWYVEDRAPIVPFVEAECDAFAGTIDVLEIGPGRGLLAGHLRRRAPARIGTYYGLDRDAVVEGPYERVERIDDVRGSIDVLIASEVIEHMPADVAFEVLDAARARMKPRAVAIVGTPNPLSPGGIARDVTHVQGYPWFDLYALMRLCFEEVEIHRTHYVCTPQRVLQLLPRVVLARLQELDWCEGLIAIGRNPRS